MHILRREVRFSIMPFGVENPSGANSYSSLPSGGDGLSVYMAMTVSMSSSVDEETGFIMNVTDIDECVHSHVVGLFQRTVSSSFEANSNISFIQLGELLTACGERLGEFTGDAKVLDVSLNLNPFRKMKIKTMEPEMIYYSEKFEFAAMHKLWNEKFDDEKNFAVFGKCANPNGHGHNYVAEVTVKCDKSCNLAVGDFERAVNEYFIELVDHSNLNSDIDYFSKNIPTVEKISEFAWEALEGKMPCGELESITVWENDRTSCTYSRDRS